MANTTYRSKVAVSTVAQREVAYKRLAGFLEHLHPLNRNLLALSWDPQGDRRVYVTLNDPLPQSEIDHHDLELAP